MAVCGYSLWQLSQLRPFWKPAAPFMPGLLPGTMIWLGLGLVLQERERVERGVSDSDGHGSQAQFTRRRGHSLGGDVHLLQLAVCLGCF